MATLLLQPSLGTVKRTFRGHLPKACVHDVDYLRETNVYLRANSTYKHSNDVIRIFGSRIFDRVLDGHCCRKVFHHKDGRSRLNVRRLETSMLICNRVVIYV